MRIVYLLRVSADCSVYDNISEVLGVRPSSTSAFWELSIDERSPVFTNAINYFVGLLEPKLEILAKLYDISAEEISVWYLYEYRGQCNIEFSATELMQLGKNAITLCISCWEETSSITIPEK